MAVDVLLQAIAEHGAAEARQILDQAREQAAAIRAAADARAEQRCAEACAAREAELRVEFDAMRDRARRKALVEVLFRRARYFDVIFAAADTELVNVFDRPGSGSLVERLSVEGLAYFPAGAARVRCRAGLAAQLASRLAPVPVVADESVAEGVVVESLDGLSRVDNTLRSRLRRQRRALSITLLAALRKGGT